MQLDGNQENMSGPPGMWSFVIQGADGNFYMQYMKPSWFFSLIMYIICQNQTQKNASIIDL